MVELEKDASTSSLWQRAAIWLRKLMPSSWSDEVFSRSILFGLPVCSVFAIWALNAGKPQVLSAFVAFLNNLPLTLPVLTVVLSIMLRPDELTRQEGWLNLCNHFSLGLVSFSIWAFVAGQNVEQYISINPVRVLNKEHSLLLVLGSFTWAGFCSVVSALANIGENSGRRKWRLMQALLVAVSLSFLTMPFYLFEDKAAVENRLGVSFDEKNFTVSIPFRDPSLNQYLGRSTDPITQCKVARGVTAKTAQEAREKALKAFRGSDDSFQFRKPDQPARLQVEILENLVVAAEN